MYNSLFSNNAFFSNNVSYKRIGVCKMKRIYKINENEYIEETIQECKSGIIIIIKGIAYIVILGALINFISKLF